MLTTRVKKALFATFGEEKLSQINTNATSEEIFSWKKSTKVSSCYKKLFVKIDKSSTYLSRILEKVWPNSDDAPEIHLAYAIGVCTKMLDPDYVSIQMVESALKPQIAQNLVSSYFRVNNT